MSDEKRVQIVLTKEQQLEVLAATGLRVTTLEVPAGDDGEEATARLPLPECLPAPAAVDAGRLKLESLEPRLAPG